MAWGSSSSADQPSRVSQLLPLFFAIVIISVIGWIVYQSLVTYDNFKKNAQRRMTRKNVNMSRDGIRVGVRQMNNEKYVDKTQGWVVKAWNLRGSSSPRHPPSQPQDEQ